MEIIEQGNPKFDVRIYQFKCKCGCRFNAAYPNDFKQFGYDILSITEMVACPVCGRLHGRGLVSELRYLFDSKSIKGEL